MLCEEGMITAKARIALLVTQSIEQVVPTKTQSDTGKTNKHCTNCVMINHNVKTCRHKKKQTMVVTTEVT